MQPMMGLSAEPTNKVGISTAASSTGQSNKKGGVPPFRLELVHGLTLGCPGGTNVAGQQASKDIRPPESLVGLRLRQVRQSAKDTNSALGKTPTKVEKNQAASGSTSKPVLQMILVSSQPLVPNVEGKLLEVSIAASAARADPNVRIGALEVASTVGELTTEPAQDGIQKLKAGSILAASSTLPVDLSGFEIGRGSGVQEDRKLGENEQNFNEQSFSAVPAATFYGDVTSSHLIPEDAPTAAVKNLISKTAAPSELQPILTSHALLSKEEKKSEPSAGKIPTRIEAMLPTVEKSSAISRSALLSDIPLDQSTAAAGSGRSKLQASPPATNSVSFNKGDNRREAAETELRPAANEGPSPAVPPMPTSAPGMKEVASVPPMPASAPVTKEVAKSTEPTRVVRLGPIAGRELKPMTALSSGANSAQSNIAIVNPAMEEVDAHAAMVYRRSGPAPPVSNFFGVMDSEESSAGQLSPLSPRTVEVGVNDPSHGWVEVRAQGVTGQVSASLNVTSRDAHEAIHAQLSGMAEYLAEREIGVRSLVVGNESAGVNSNFNGNSAGAGTSGESARDADSGESESKFKANRMWQESPISPSSPTRPGLPAYSPAEVGGTRHLINLRV